MKSRLQTKGMLFLIPNLISSNGDVSAEVRMAIKNIKHYLAETPKAARKFLRYADSQFDFESIKISKYDKSTSPQELEEIMNPLFEGNDMGIITDSGMPGIADPGSSAVDLAHKWSVAVKPLPGPSSIILGLAASGLPGQQFCFHGYLPINSKECISKLKKFEHDSARNNSSQIFIETPYRNEKLFKLLVKTLRPDTWLCLGYDITGESEKIISKPVKEWFRESFVPKKLPCLYIIYSGS